MRGVVRGVVIAAMIGVLLTGCISPYKIPGADDEYLVMKAMQSRDLFGTNNSGAIVEQCKGPAKTVLFYFEADFKPCQSRVVVDGVVHVTLCNGPSCEVRPITLFHGYSQGQGGQIVSGMMNAAALGGVAAVAGSAGNAASSASTTVINQVPRGHHR